jgi:hypothetical protein
VSESGRVVRMNLFKLCCLLQEIDKLKKSISALESAVQPKKKFSFSSRNKGKKSAG